MDQLAVIEGLVRALHPSSPINSSFSPGSVCGSGQQIFPQILRENQSTDSERTALALNVDTSYGVATDEILQWPVFEKLLSTLPRFKYRNFRGLESYSYLGDVLNQSDDSASRLALEHSSDMSKSLSISTERVDIEQLVELFFTRVNIKNPILSRQVVSQYCQQYYEHGPRFNLETCLILLTCALGALSTQFNPADTGQHSQLVLDPSERLANLRLGQCYFTAAEKRLGAAISSTNTTAIQCLCLAGWVMLLPW